MERYYRKWYIPLVLPAMALFTVVILLPFAAGVFYAFTAWRGAYFAGGENAFQAFVGLENFKRVFTSEKFIGAFVYTLKFTLISVVMINVTGMALALLVMRIRRAAGVFRTVFFVPNLLGGLALGYIWAFVFEIVFSQILFGTQGLDIPFLRNMTQDNTKSLFALALLVSWQMAGYMMLIYINGLGSVPREVAEAARIDGAGPFRVFRSVTLPMIMPSITIVFFLSLAYSFKLLDQNVALTDGNFGTRMLALQILRTVRETSPPDYGLAQAQAVVFFILVASVTLVQVMLTRKREVEA